MKRDHDRLPRDSHRLDNREDLLDLLESNRFEHRIRMKPQMNPDSQKIGLRSPTGTAPRTLADEILHACSE